MSVGKLHKRLASRGLRFSYADDRKNIPECWKRQVFNVSQQKQQTRVNCSCRQERGVETSSMLYDLHQTPNKEHHSNNLNTALGSAVKLTAWRTHLCVSARAQRKLGAVASCAPSNLQANVGVKVGGNFAESSEFYQYFRSGEICVRAKCNKKRPRSFTFIKLCCFLQFLQSLHESICKKIRHTGHFLCFVVIFLRNNKKSWSGLEL